MYPGHIGVVRPSSAKVKIFAKLFFTHECEKIAKSAKNQKMHKYHMIKEMQEL